jgi:hypothetical protein
MDQNAQQHRAGHPLAHALDRAPALLFTEILHNPLTFALLIVTYFFHIIKKKLKHTVSLNSKRLRMRPVVARIESIPIPVHRSSPVIISAAGAPRYRSGLCRKRQQQGRPEYCCFLLFLTPPFSNLTDSGFTQTSQ